ncbi:MAG: hypothetical protein SV765_12900 [Pseudomonadota bacterium]|nr:hypothetical protein [Pseudomonadales bacterium]MDY6921096.1 hypothetical protein [Pseudomonadota bacterium]|tara:strand:+ start:75 stop:479 length:405 start_codon:yes stop_codon:yes gene_type:complete
MNKLSSGFQAWVQLGLVLLLALGGISCSDAAEDKGGSGKDAIILPDTDQPLMPFAIFFTTDGKPVPFQINAKRDGYVPVKIRDRKDPPVEGKILGIEPISVIYVKGSCIIPIKTGKIEYTITIEDDNICKAMGH